MFLSIVSYSAFSSKLADRYTNCTLLLAPMLEDIDISYDVVQFNGTFVHENIYRQGAGPEVDAAWEALGVGCE
jgi:hypothetical protein